MKRQIIRHCKKKKVTYLFIQVHIHVYSSNPVACNQEQAFFFATQGISGNVKTFFIVTTGEGRCWYLVGDTPSGI